MKNITKSLILFLVATFLSVYTTPVKSQAFGNGDLVLNAGIGLGSVWAYNYVYSTSQWPTIYASGEKGIVKIQDIGVISVGGEMAFRHVSVSNINYNWNEFYIGPRGAFHLSMLKVEKLDVYGGVSFGLRFFSEPTYVYTGGFTYRWEKQTHTNLYEGLFVGGKYYFTKNFGVFSELGYEITVFKLGIVYKF